jgi:hypothetical protein
MSWNKFCLPGNLPTYCNGISILPVADPTRTLTVTAVTVASGTVTVTASANFPAGFAANTPIDLEGVTGSGVSGINGGALTKTVSTNTLTFADATATCGTGCVTTGATIAHVLAPDVKNALELKNGLRVLIEGNILGPGCTWEGQSDQFGECWHLNLLQGRYNALPGDTLSNVTGRYNLISGANKGLIVTEEEAGNVGPAGGNGPTLNPATGPFSIHDNLFDDLNSTKWGLSSAGVPQLGGIAVTIGNPFAGPYVPQSITVNHNTFVQSTAQGATPIAQNRAQLLSTTDFSGRAPLAIGTAKTSINADGTGTVTFATCTSGCTSFTPDPLGYYMEMPIGSGNWAQILSWTSATTYRVNPNLGTNTTAISFRIQCAGMGGPCATSESSPLTPWPRMTFKNNIAVGGAFNGLAAPNNTQTTVAALNFLMDTTSANGWCWNTNILATGAVSGQAKTWVYPQIGSSGPNTGCGTTTITSTGCTAKVGAASSPCLNPDTSDTTFGTVGFTSYTAGNVTSLLPGGTNDYTLLNTSPGWKADAGADLGADMTKVTSYTTGVQ